MEYQVINGKKFPPFPFYAKTKNIDWVVKVVGVCETDSDRFLAELFFDNCTIPIAGAMVLSITEITFDEQPVEKKYRPWNHDDIGSLLFFKDKVFRYKNASYQTNVTSFINDEDSARPVALLFHENDWFEFDELFDKIEYSTDGKTWLPCGVEI